MIKGQERIQCAAIWFKELPLKNPEVLTNRGFAPYNVDVGVVMCGWRHPNVLYQMVAITGLSSYKAGKNIQGFLTNKNRFVDRKEGAQIAMAAGQIISHKTTFNEKMLFSEDIY